MSTNIVDGVDLSARVLKATQHVYVSSTGLDANPGTAALPKLTLAGAYALLPAIQDRHFCIHLSSGTFSYTRPPTIVQRPGAMIAIVGDGGGQAGQDGFTVQATGTIAAGSTVSTFKTLEPLVIGAHVGHTLEITSGTLAGYRRTITDNTDTDIRPSAQCYVVSTPQAPAEGVTYRILRPSAYLTNATGTWAQDGGTSLAFVNLQMQTIATGRGPAQIWYGIELIGGSLLEVDTKLYAGGVRHGLATNSQEANQLVGVLLSATGISATTLKWEGWGISSIHPTMTIGLLVGAGQCFQGYLTAIGQVIADAASGDAEVVLLGGRCGSLGGPSGRILVANPDAGMVFLLVPKSTGYAAITLSADARIAVLGDVEIRNDLTTNSVLLADSARLTIRGNLTILGGSTGGQISLSGHAELSVRLTISITAANAAAVQMFQGSRLFCNTLNAATGKGTALYGSPMLNARYISLSGPAAEPALALYGGKVCIGNEGANNTLTLSCTAPGTGALRVEDGGQVIGNTSTVANVTNLSTAAASDGIRALSGGRVVFPCAGDPTIATSGSTGYGVNCRGGGVYFSRFGGVNITAPTAKFSVGTAAGEDFSETALAASFAYKAAGASVVQKSY